MLGRDELNCCPQRGAIDAWPKAREGLVMIVARAARVLWRMVGARDRELLKPRADMLPRNPDSNVLG